MRALILIFTLTICISSQAQSLNGWMMYFANTQIKDSKFSLHHELQLRDYKIIGDHNQTLIRVGGQYQFKPSVQATLGYGFIHTELENSPNNPFVEHRVYQEGLFSHRILSSRIRHRARLEERFIENQNFRGRIRYCLFADIPLSKWQFDKNGIYLAVYNEFFLNVLNNNSIKAFDRNRTYAGLGYKLQQNLGLQLGYMRQHVVSNSRTNHLMLSVHHSMYL